MTESIPFLHLVGAGVIDVVTSKDGTTESAMPSVVVAYALWKLLTGTVSCLGGSFQLGQVICIINGTR